MSRVKDYQVLIERTSVYREGKFSNYLFSILEPLEEDLTAMDFEQLKYFSESLAAFVNEQKSEKGGER